MELLITRLIELAAILVVGGSIVLVKNVHEEIKYRQREKEWHNQSFEFNGARCNKDTFEIVNGKLAFKSNT